MSPRFFFATLSQPCPYLPGRSERKIVTEIAGRDAPTLYDRLVRGGYRRSHGVAYRPACLGCDACVPVRIPVADFRPGRSMRRVLKVNADLEVEERPATVTGEQYALFRRYVRARHADGGMTFMDFSDYRAMVEETPVHTTVFEFRDGQDRLIAVALTDLIADGLSASYMFFDPDASRRSPGTFVVLWHVDEARARGLSFVYLGYWIAGCQKMAYKARFQPLEALGPEGWRRLNEPASAGPARAPSSGCAAGRTVQCLGTP
ncbi:MAG: arginyltransferase [Alphaproteobacteria bacterium]